MATFTFAQLTADVPANDVMLRSMPYVPHTNGASAHVLRLGGVPPPITPLPDGVEEGAVGEALPRYYFAMQRAGQPMDECQFARCPHELLHHRKRYVYTFAAGLEGIAPETEFWEDGLTDMQIAVGDRVFGIVDHWFNRMWWHDKDDTPIVQATLANLLSDRA